MRRWNIAAGLLLLSTAAFAELAPVARARAVRELTPELHESLAEAVGLALRGPDVFVVRTERVGRLYWNLNRILFSGERCLVWKAFRNPEPIPGPADHPWVLVRGGRYLLHDVGEEAGELWLSLRREGPAPGDDDVFIGIRCRNADRGMRLDELMRETGDTFCVGSCPAQ